MLQISTVQLMALFVAACKVFDIRCTYLLANRLNLLSDGYLQSSNGLRVHQTDVVE